MRRFNLVRNEDESGVSGTGLVVQGVQFDDGQVCINWMTGHQNYPHPYPSIRKVLDIHGHNGKTVVEWLDD